MSDRTDSVIPLRRSPVDEARDGYLDRFANPHTRQGYRIAIDAWLHYCHTRAYDPFTVTRAQLEHYGRHLEDERGLKPSTVSQHQTAIAGFYRMAFVDGSLDRDPMEFVKRRKVPDKSSTNGLTRFELADVIAAAEHDRDPRAHPLACLLGLNGMRISGALGIDVDRVNAVRYQQPTVTIVLKGEDELTVPLSLRTAEAIRTLIGDRTSGPLFVTSSGRRWRRNHAHAIVVRVARAAGITKRIHPHSLRHAFVTNALDQGVPMRDVMGSTGHKDPRSMLRYDRSRGAIERNATWSVSALIEGLIRPA